MSGKKHGNERPTHHRPTAEQMDERVKLPDDPEKVIEAVLKVDPESEPTERPSDSRPKSG